jgi:hypothetical protein
MTKRKVLEKIVGKKGDCSDMDCTYKNNKVCPLYDICFSNSMITNIDRQRISEKMLEDMDIRRK